MVKTVSRETFGKTYNAEDLKLVATRKINKLKKNTVTLHSLDDTEHCYKTLQSQHHPRPNLSTS